MFNKVLKLLINLLLFTPHLLAFQVSVNVTDAFGVVDLWTHNSKDPDYDLLISKATSMHRAASDRECRMVRSAEDGDRVCGSNPKSVRHSRKKRETYAECKARVHALQGAMGITAELTKIVSIPCHLCDEKKNLESRVWFRFIREELGYETLWHAVEVKLDTHDNPRLNRRIVSPEHDLTIKDFQNADAGIYFCTMYNKKAAKKSALLTFRTENIDESSPIAMAIAWQKETQASEISNLIYIDVMAPVTTIAVSKLYASNYPRPREAKKNTKSNWIMFTEWAEWGDCSQCGTDGERRRYGRCRVRKLDPDLPSQPDYLEEVFKLYPLGAACQSSIFSSRPEVFDISDEIHVGECDVKCKDSFLFSMLKGIGIGSLFNGAGFNLLKMGYDKIKNSDAMRAAMGYQDELNEGDIVTIIKKEGMMIDMHCPGYYLESAVTWYYNGTTKLLALDLSKLSGRRIEIDAKCSIVIHQLLMNDSGRYSCYVDFKVTVDIFLIVLQDDLKVAALWPNLIIYLSFCAASLAVYIFIVVTKESQYFTRAHAYRTKESRRRRGQKKRRLNYSANANSVNFNSNAIVYGLYFEDLSDYDDDHYDNCNRNNDVEDASEDNDESCDCRFYDVLDSDIDINSDYSSSGTDFSFENY